MIHLTSANIQLHARAATKEDAIRQAGSLLVANGNSTPGYVDSMLGRELQANTYLGNGIAIHGAVILVGLGVTEPSMSILNIAAVKARLHQISRPQAQALARQALACATADEVRQLALA